MISTILQSEPRRKIWLYFLDLRIRYALALLVVGLILAEFLPGKLLLLAGLSWLLAALIVDRARPSEQELDRLLSHEIEGVTERAQQSQEAREDERRAAPLALLEPDAVAPTPYFTRPRTDRAGGRRSPVNRVVVLLPMEDRLGIYSCCHDTLEDRTSQVSAEEHHYREVASVVLEKDFEGSAGAGKPAALRTTQILSLVLTSGQRLSFPASFAWEVGEAGPTSLERILRALQKLLQDYR